MIEVSLLELARTHVARLPALRPDVAADDEEVLDSLCQFDALAVLACIHDAGTLDTRAWYTSFAHYEWTRSEPAIVRVIADPSVREAIFPDDDAALAAAIREISEIGRDQSFRYSIFGGWTSRTVSAFLAANPPSG